MAKSVCVIGVGSTTPSVMRNATERADYILQRNRRYAHSLAYIHRLAEQAHLAPSLINQVKLRRQDTGEANGVIVVLQSGADRK
jgi:predicted TPR repeat methyltransferase